MNNGVKPPKFLGLIFLLAGLGSLIFIGSKSYKSNIIIKQSVKTIGTVLDYDISSERSLNTVKLKGENIDSIYYYETVYLSYENNGKIESSSSQIKLRNKSPIYEVGDTCNIYIKDDNIFIEDELKNNYLWFSPIGLLFIYVGLWALIKRGEKNEDCKETYVNK